MKALIQNSKHFLSLNNFINQQSLRCESTLRSLVSRPYSAWRYGSAGVRMKWTEVLPSAGRVLLTGLSASRTSLLLLLRNKRHLVGLVLLLLGVVSWFVNQWVSDPITDDHRVCRLLGFTMEQCNKETGWCYTSWFYYLETIRTGVVFVLWSLAGILYVPIKKSVALIPFSLFNAFGWLWIYHFSFEVHSYSTYHLLPEQSIIYAGIALGFAVVISSNYLLYWANHKMRGNHARFVGVARLPMKHAEKEQMYDLLAKEYGEINKMI